MRGNASKDKTPTEHAVLLPSRKESGVSEKQYDSIKETLEAPPEKKRKRTKYTEEEKMKIVKYAASHGVASALRYFRKDFPNLTESTVRPWLSKYRDEIKKKSADLQSYPRKEGDLFYFQLN